MRALLNLALWFDRAQMSDGLLLPDRLWSMNSLHIVLAIGDHSVQSPDNNFSSILIILLLISNQLSLISERSDLGHRRQCS